MLSFESGWKGVWINPEGLGHRFSHSGELAVPKRAAAEFPLFQCLGAARGTVRQTGVLTASWRGRPAIRHLNIVAQK